MIFALQDASTAYSYALGRICGLVLLAALIIAVFQSLFSRKQVFSGAAKYLLVVVVIIAGGIFALIYTHRQGATAELSGGPSSANAETTITQQPATPRAPDPELDRLLAEAQRQYNALEKQRAALDTKNTKSVQAFNQQASTYKELLVRIEARRRGPSPTSTPPSR